MADMNAGAGRARIVLPSVTPAGEGPDPLRVRVLVLEDGVAPVVVCVIDPMLPPQSHAGIARVLGHVTHTEADRVLVCAPPAVDATRPALEPGEALQHAIEDAVAWAAFGARSTCRPARLTHDRVEDAEGLPLALLRTDDVPVDPCALERDHNDQTVALVLTRAVATRLADLLPSTR
jgi:hypothetical protein